MELNENRKRKRKRKIALPPTKSGKPSKKIPKECLENALSVVNDEKNMVLKDQSSACEKNIHHHQESISLVQNHTSFPEWEIQLRYARECLMRRDWRNLTEILLLYKPNKFNTHLFPIYAKYASICLAYTNHPLLKSFLQSLGCNESTEVVLEKWTKLPKSSE